MQTPRLAMSRMASFRLLYSGDSNMTETQSRRDELQKQVLSLRKEGKSIRGNR